MKYLLINAFVIAIVSFIVSAVAFAPNIAETWVYLDRNPVLQIQRVFCMRVQKEMIGSSELMHINGLI